MIQVNPEKDRAQVVAEVNGEKILKGEVLDRLDREKAFYNLTEEAIKDKNNKEQVLEIKKSILDQIVTEKLLSQKAQEAGFVVTDELKEEARKEFEDIKKSIEEQIREADALNEEEQEDEEDQEEQPEDKDYAKEAEDYINDQLDMLGMSQEEYIDFLAEQKCIEKLYDQIVDDVQVADQDIDNYYNEELTTQKDNISFIEMRPIILYEPPRVKVRHVLVEIPEAKSNEYRTLVNDKKEEEAQNLLDKELEIIKGRADSITKRAKDGEDFLKLVEEVNPDSLDVMKEGITFSKGNLYLPEEYMEAAFKLQDGQVSDPVATPYGYYIIQLDEKYSEKTYTLDEKKEEIKDLLESQKRDEKWKEVVDDWKEKLTKKYERRL